MDRSTGKRRTVTKIIDNVAKRRAAARVEPSAASSRKTRMTFLADDLTSCREAQDLLDSDGGLAPDAIVANASPSGAALQQATNTTTIVFRLVSEPIAQAELLR
jgi:hypothetical protein